MDSRFDELISESPNQELTLPAIDAHTNVGSLGLLHVWVVRVGGHDGEPRPWHYIYVYSIESRLI